LRNRAEFNNTRITPNGTESVAGISSITKEQTDILAALTTQKNRPLRPNWPSCSGMIWRRGYMNQ
jgi:hypothetical protein